MADVTFTKNVTPENRTAGLAALDIFFRNSIFQVAPYNMATSLSGLISFLDSKYPTYIEFLGETAKSITPEQLTQSMLNVTRNGKKSYPTPADFANGIIAAVGSLRSDIQTTMKVITETAQETISTLSNFGSIALKYLPYALGGLAIIFILSKSGAGDLAASYYRAKRKSNPKLKSRRKK